MKCLIALTSVLMFIACSGCGDSQEALAGEGLDTMKKLNTVFEGIKDEASAKAAKPELKKLMEQMKSIQERQKKLPLPTDADFKAMEAKYGKEMEEVQKKFTGNMLRIAFDPKIRAQLDDLDAVMKKSGG